MRSQTLRLRDGQTDDDLCPVTNVFRRLNDAQSSQSRPADGFELVDLLLCKGLCRDRIGKAHRDIDIREAILDVIKSAGLLDVLEAGPLQRKQGAIASLDWIGRGGDGFGDIQCRCLLLAGHEVCILCLKQHDRLCLRQRSWLAVGIRPP